MYIVDLIEQVIRYFHQELTFIIIIIIILFFWRLFIIVISSVFR